jgi:hypothetical protein
MSLIKTLIYWLDILRIERDTGIYQTAMDLAQKEVPIESVNNDNNVNSNPEWINAMKIIADVYCYSIKNNNNDATAKSYIFSQSQLCDFVTLSARGIDERIVKTEMVCNAILKIYRDIVENFQTFNHRLISNYPSIIVDVISIINSGINSKGYTVSSISIDKYYLSRKQHATNDEEEDEDKVLAPIQMTTTVAAAATIHKDKIILSSSSKEELVESLCQITNRRRNDIEESLDKLQKQDLKRLSELCQNYSRIQKYSKLLITKGSKQQEFKNEIERQLGRKLGPHQLWRAVNSVKRVRTYIENILDNKFIPDISDGINYVKHNLEYGYQLMCLIERTRSRRQKNSV